MYSDDDRLRDWIEDIERVHAYVGEYDFETFTDLPPLRAACAAALGERGADR